MRESDLCWLVGVLEQVPWLRSEFLSENFKGKFFHPNFSISVAMKFAVRTRYSHVLVFTRDVHWTKTQG